MGVLYTADSVLPIFRMENWLYIYYISVGLSGRSFFCYTCVKYTIKSMDDPIMIDAHDIRFSYDGPGGRRSLNGAQLHVSPGEFVAVLGHNGCGKSTLVKHFNALLPLQHGTLTVDGMDAADPDNRWALRRKVGMVFQNSSPKKSIRKVMRRLTSGRSVMTYLF